MRTQSFVALTASLAASSAFAQLPRFEGFESFTLGSVSGQHGWQIAGGEPTIADSNPATGARHLHLTRAAGGFFNGATSPWYNIVADRPHSVSVDIYISTLGAQEARVFSDAAAGPVSVNPWDVRFRPDGRIFVLDDEDGLPGGSGANLDTGARWTPGAYFTLRVDRNPIANTIQYFLNDSLFYTGSSVGLWGGHTAERVLLFGNNGFGPSDFTDYDNFLVIPAPGAMALGGIVGVVVARRRR